MSPADFDVYQGMSWTERARYGVFGIALDLADRSGKKNHFMDAVHQNAIRRTLNASPRPYERALDFGCGGGRLLPLLKEYAAQVYGVDRTPACVELARAQNIIPPERLICWRNGPLPFADGFFDLILCVYVLLTSAALHELSVELARVCKPGGRTLVLEQTDNARGLTLDHYRAAFGNAGFSLHKAQAVRRSGGSRPMNLATRSWAPNWIGALAARWELARMKTAHYEANTPGYFDYVFDLQKD